MAGGNAPDFRSRTQHVLHADRGARAAREPCEGCSAFLHSGARLAGIPQRAYNGPRTLWREPHMSNQNTRWSETSDVIPIFPTLVWKIELEAQLREAICAQALAALARMRRDLPPLAPGTGWQSVQSLHELDDFRDLVSCVHRVVPGILRFLRIGYDAYQVTACWATVLARGAAHKIHQHPNNFLSGVYYVRTHPGADTINFHDPRNQTGIIRPPVVELTAENTDQVVVKVKDGTMLVFPAYLQHSVDASASEDERISISFNIMFSSFTENLSKPLW
jgi:uncharacterized protein (TIGR02466 family)